MIKIKLLAYLDFRYWNAGKKFSTRNLLYPIKKIDFCEIRDHQQISL